MLQSTYVNKKSLIIVKARDKDWNIEHKIFAEIQQKNVSKMRNKEHEMFSFFLLDHLSQPKACRSSREFLEQEQI